MKPQRKTKGQTIILVALCATILLALVGLAVDGGSAMNQRRSLQNGTDAAALAVIQMWEAAHFAVSCQPSPCHPVIPVSNGATYTKAQQMVLADLGNAAGTVSTPVIDVDYHIVSGSTGCTPAASYPTGCFIDSPNNANDTTHAVADSGSVDGVRVTASVNNPTTFGKVVNFNSIAVSTVSAAKVSATCPSQDQLGPPLPYTRFRPAFETEELAAAGNDPAHIYDFWNAHGDIGQGNSNWKSLISFGVSSMYQSGATQLLTAFDLRNGAPPAGVGYNVDNNTGSPTPSQGWANMAGTGTLTVDVPNWTYYAWTGTISLTQPHSIPGITVGGDWGETFGQGDHGHNIDSSLRQDITDHGLNNGLYSSEYGKVRFRTVYLWGPSLTEWNAQGHNNNSAQHWNPPHYQGQTFYPGAWETLDLTPFNGQAFATAGNDSIDRVRFTRVVNVAFYEGIQANNSSANGILEAPSALPGGGCQAWQIGSSYYGGMIDPR